MNQAVRTEIESLPNYVRLPEPELISFLSAAGIKEKDEILFFQQICRFARENKTGQMDLDEFSFDLIRWAELNNMVRFRHLQNVQRLLGQLLPRLKEKDLVQVKEKEGVPTSIILLEPGQKKQEELLKQLANSVANPFPSKEDLPFPIPESYFFTIPISEFNETKIQAAIEEKKPVRIHFGPTETDVYCPYAYLTDLPRLARLKIKTVLFPQGQRTKLLDDLVRDLKAVMPEKVISAERILHVLEGREHEVPLYLLNLSSRFITYMQQEREFKYRVTAVQAGKILMQQKLFEEEKKKAELEETERKFDQKRALEMLKSVKKLVLREELLSVEMEKTLWQPLSNRYQGAALRLLLSQMIDEYSHLKRDENPQDILPPLVRFKGKQGEYYIHRDSLTEAFLNYRESIKEKLEKDYLVTWAELLRQGNSELAMQFDEFFIKDVQKKIHQNYWEFALLLSEPQLVMNSIFYSPMSQTERGDFLTAFFVRPSEPIFKPYHVILDLDRKLLLRKAKASLPLSYRFFLFRWFLWFLRLFQKNPKSDVFSSTEEAKSQQNSELSPNWSHTVTLELEKLKNHYIGSENLDEELNRLEDSWNIKIGPVRDVLVEKIQREVQEKTKKIYQLLKKTRANEAGFLKKEIENLADRMVAKAEGDVANKEAYRKYLILLALKELTHL